MYDRDAMSAVEFRVIRDADLEIDHRYGPWLNPPFYAWVFAPLSALPYRQAAALFLGINLLLITTSLILLAKKVAVPVLDPAGAIHSSRLDWKTTLLVPVLILLPLPFWQAMGHQQNTFISLLLLVLAVVAWQQGKPFHGWRGGRAVIF